MCLHVPSASCPRDSKTLRRRLYAFCQCLVAADMDIAWAMRRSLSFQPAEIATHDPLHRQHRCRPCTHFDSLTNLRQLSRRGFTLEPCTQGLAHVLLEQYQEAEAALLEGLSLEPRHDGMLATMATVTAALEPEPTSPTSPAASTPKRSGAVAASATNLGCMPRLCSRPVLSSAYDGAMKRRGAQAGCVRSVTSRHADAATQHRRPSGVASPCVDHLAERSAGRGCWTAPRTTWSASCA